MICLQHNVKGNFMNAAGFGSDRLKEDIILSEIAKLIVVKPEVIVGYLNEAGLPVKGIPGKARLVKLVTKGIAASKKFATLLAKEMVGAGTQLNGDGDTGSGGGQDWGAMATSTASIVNSLAVLFAKPKKGNPPAQQNLQNHVQAVNTIANDGWSTSTKVLVGFAIGIPLIIGGIFAIRALR